MSSQQPPYGPPQQPYQPQQGPQYGPPPQYHGPLPYQPQYQQYPQYGGQQFGPPPGGPGFGWGPQFGQQHPPKRKKSKAWIAVPIVLGFALVAGLWTIGVINKHNRHKDYTAPQPTYSSTQPSDQPGSPDPSAPATQPTSRPSVPRPTRTTPPPPRQPTAWEVASRDKIYRVGVQRSVGCREPRVQASSVAGARAYYLPVKACLDRAWRPQLAAAGDPFRSPNLVAMSGPAISPCGGGAPSAFYCSANETIYMDAVDDVKLYRRSSNSQSRAFHRAAMLDTLAHEYGHHVQFLSGTLRAYRRLAYEAPTRAKELELARRKELQATCFGAIFIGANRQSYPVTGSLKRQWNWLTANSGDEYGPVRDHGSREVQPYWVNRAFTTRNLAACNTFTATSDKVR